ncbi:hypothetical protein KHQ06_12870 [Nocardia tengchongensis]|uniref:Ig-like domain-containing protein n=1 Tax=Nocardia tengchongensis TaxID=2055889 RepID=A0ABX8CYT9_9NOCA|nr:hypothetical protein [Nocardia tengchongensis]QVI23655.1 hypothetical protein KHQ06_12870 [Nocardia tengchongensis]
MKFLLTHRVSTLLATALAAAALATGAATAAPLTLDPVATPTDSGSSSASSSGSAMLNQYICESSGGTWVAAGSYCHAPFNPSARTIDPAPLTVAPVATPTGSSSSGSANMVLCRLTGQGDYWRSDYGCTNVPPFVS